MCGIAGVFRFDGHPADDTLLATMSACLHHRGPDDEGCFRDGSIGLAFRRLAILDCSPAGHQPMIGPDNTTVLIFNGEIYNFCTLRDELATRGHHFRSASDTEVLLAAYAEWGIDCLNKLSGMWAFAIWDARRQRLFCARDRFGIKPLYYHRTAERLIFASEIKALFADPTTPNRPNDPRIYDFLVYGYLDHRADTCFDQIMQIPAGHFLLAQTDGTLSIRHYWQITPQPTLTLSDDEASTRFADLFTQSVRLHLQSDVPIGTCLSGGLDSSSIVVVAHDLLRTSTIERTTIGPRQRTFSACYDDARYDERRFMQAVIAYTGVTNAQTFPDSRHLLDDLDAFIWHQEQPCGSTSVYAQWCVMRLAHQHGITVLLDGQGADELLAGYPIYQAAWWATLAQQGHWLHLRRELIGYSQRFGAARAARLREAVRLVLPEALAAQISTHLGTPQPDWLGPRLHHQRWERPPIAPTFSDPLHRLMHNYLVALNLPALLRYEDRNAMAFSIEARVPFLDEHLAEFAFRLPGAQLLRNGESKWVLRQALRHLLPDIIATRQDKIGFATPGDDWLRNDLRPLAEEVLSAPSLAQRGYILPAQAQTRWAHQQAGHSNQHHLIWRWLHLELWARRFLDRRPSLAVPTAGAVVAPITLSAHAATG